MKYEYLLFTWGGFYNRDYFKEHGYKEGSYYFETEKQRDRYRDTLISLSNELKAYQFMYIEAEGFCVRDIPKLHRVVRYKGKDYYSSRDCHPDFTYDSARYFLEFKWYPGFNDYPLGENFNYESRDYEVVEEWITGSFSQKYELNSP